MLPTPIVGSLSMDVWGAPEVGPRDPNNGLEDKMTKQWSYWDGQITVERPEGYSEHDARLSNISIMVRPDGDFMIVPRAGGDASSSKIVVIPFDGAALDHDLPASGNSDQVQTRSLDICTVPVSKSWPLPRSDGTRE